MFRAILRIAFTTFVTSSLTQKLAAHDLPLCSHELYPYAIRNCEKLPDLPRTQVAATTDELTTSDRDREFTLDPFPSSPFGLSGLSQCVSQGSDVISFELGRETTARILQWISEFSAAASSGSKDVFVATPCVGKPPAPGSSVHAERSGRDERLDLPASEAKRFATQEYLSYDLSVRDWRFRGYKSVVRYPAFTDMPSERIGVHAGYGLGEINAVEWRLPVDSALAFAEANLERTITSIVGLASKWQTSVLESINEVAQRQWAKPETRKPLYVEPNFVLHDLGAGVTVVLTRKQARDWGLVNSAESASRQELNLGDVSEENSNRMLGINFDAVNFEAAFGATTELCRSGMRSLIR